MVATTTVRNRPVQPEPTLPSLAIGSTIDRFEILGLLGEGGMGRVYRAHDPRLHRNVALKLLHRTTDRDSSSARLLREARSMARLSHPNLLPIFDVGRHAEGLFIAMELVEGQTLGQWFRARPRTPSEVLTVMLAAGRGLLAAHAAGLIHRDFKPSNVMIGDDGRVRVMDLGLARLSDDVDYSDVDSHPIATPSLDGSLTLTGIINGSPAYMAPEQHRGDRLDARTDQYSFCVVLWEGLLGARPFDERSYGQIVSSKHCGPPELPAEPRIPGWLHDPLRRGLAVDPGARFPSMEALLTELQLQPLRARRRRRLAWVAGLALLGGGGLFVLLPGEVEAPCQGAGAKLTGVWDAEARQRVEAAVLATGVPHASDTWQRLAPRLDDYATRWAADYGEACAATRVRHEQSEALMDARMRCLDGHRRELMALVRTLETADDRAVGRAVEATEDLPRLERCADAEWVQHQVPPPDDPEVRREVDALRDELSRARLLQGSGKQEEASAVVNRVHERALALGYGPLEAQATLRLGQLEQDLGHYPEAAEALRQAYFTAERWGQHEVQARAAVDLVFVLGHHQQQHADAEQWFKHAEAMVERLGDDDLRAQLLTSLGSVRESQARHEEARQALQQALDLRVAMQEPDRLDLALILNDIGIVEYSMGHYDAALESFARSSAVQERVLGPLHPQTARSLGNLGAAYEAVGRFDEALEHYRRSLAVQEQQLGKRHPMVALLLNNIGIVLVGQGKLDEALEHYRRALAIREEVLGTQHPDTATSIDSIGGVLQEQGHLEEAEAHQRRALAIRKEALGPRHPSTAVSLNNLGEVMLARGEILQAEQLNRRALEIREQVLGPEHPSVASSANNLGQALAAQGRHDEALRSLRRALEIWERTLEPQHPNLANCRRSIEASLAAQSEHDGAPPDAPRVPTPAPRPAAPAP